AELARRHRHWAGPAQQVLDADHALAEQGGGALVERARAADTVGAAQLQMILEIAADLGPVEHRRDAERRQPGRIADARSFENRRRTDRAGREQDFAARPRDAPLAAEPVG